MVKEMRWPDGKVNARVAARKAISSPIRVWKCGGCKKQFSLKIGTVMEDSPIGLDKWLSAFWLIVNAKNSISSYEIHRALGVTQKTAWFLLHRIRLAMQEGLFSKMSGEVEADETFIGGSARFMHKGKKPSGTGMVGNVAVMGLLERTTAKKTSRVRCKVVGTVRRQDVDLSCASMSRRVASVHRCAPFVCASRGRIHPQGDRPCGVLRKRPNSHERSGKLLVVFKRCVRGTHVNVEPFHLFRYLDEQCFRFNERKNEDGDKGRFLLALQGMVGKGLRYNKLIGQMGESDQLPGLPNATA